MISDAIIRTITRWLPTLDEARLRRVSGRDDARRGDGRLVPHRARQGDAEEQELIFAPAHPSNGSHRVGWGDYHPWYGPCDAFGFDSKCSECQRITLHLRRQQVESGLRELAAATPVKAAAPGILLDFDMSDIGDEP